MKFEIIKHKQPEFRPIGVKLSCETLADVQRLIQLFSIDKSDSKLMEELKYQLETMGYNVNEMYKR